MTFLASHGYPASGYAVLISWREQIPRAPGSFVVGYHVRPRQGGEAFDLYSDASGNLLGPAKLALLGIRAKRWNLPPIEQAAEIPPPVAKTLPPRPVAVGVSKSVPIGAAVLLPEIDLTQALLEDEERQMEQGKGATRIGVFQDLEEPIQADGPILSHGFWDAVPGGGQLWSVAIYSPEALGLRIHFDRITIPEGASVLLYNAQNPSEAYGPYTQPAPGMTDLWSATCFTDTAVVECFVPAGVDLSGVHLGIDRVVHNYVAFGDLAWAKLAGTCNNDVTCYPAWSSAATGVGGVGSIGGDGSFFCTGSLLADTDQNTDIPYLLTANHCVSTSNQAANLEIYWLYQTGACNDAPPDPASVPRTTGGAALLATTDAANGTDFCLLRLNNAPPSGLTHLGWSSTETALATATACIHHPQADYKRLSFGVVTDVAESLRNTRPASRFYQSSWTSGTTEPGSSGSPLFIESSQLVIGQLWGGPGACSSSTNLDYFGRFDVGFPIMAPYLDPQPITGAVQVVQPNGGENWTTGSTRDILWTSTGSVGATVRIELWRNGGPVTVIYGSTTNDGQASWTIDGSLSTGGGYKVRILSSSAPNILDDSDSTFSLSSPPAPPSNTTWVWRPFRLLLALLQRLFSFRFGFSNALLLGALPS